MLGLLPVPKNYTSCWQRFKHKWLCKYHNVCHPCLREGQKAEKRKILETVDDKVRLKGGRKSCFCWILILNYSWPPTLWTIPVSGHLFAILTLACCILSFLSAVSMCVFQPWTCVQHWDSFCFSWGYMGSVQDLQRVSWVTQLSLQKCWSPGITEDRPV